MKVTTKKELILTSKKDQLFIPIGITCKHAQAKQYKPIKRRKRTNKGFLRFYKVA